MTGLHGGASFGMSLPHRSVGPISPDVVQRSAADAERLGFASLWVTENSVNTTKPHVQCLDPVVALSFAAAATRRVALGVGVSIINMHQPLLVAHQWASLDHISGGRALLGVGLGRDFNYAEFNVPVERRVRRLLETTHLLRQLWAGGIVDFDGEVVRLAGSSISLTPPNGTIPVLFAGTAPAAIDRAVAVADGWIAPGAGPLSDLPAQVRYLRDCATRRDRILDDFWIVKRVHVAVDDGTGRPRRQLDEWFTSVYESRLPSTATGIAGSAESVAEQLIDIVDAGVNHIVLSPVADHLEQQEALAEVVGLLWPAQSAPTIAPRLKQNEGIA